MTFLIDLNFFTTPPPCTASSLDDEVLVTVFVIVVVVVLEVSCLVLVLLLPEFPPCELVVVSVFFTVVIFEPELSHPERPLPLLL